MSGLTAVSLFGGIGGFDLALGRAGVRVVAAVESDPAARSVLARHFPEAKLFNDVTEVTGDQLRAAGFVPGRGILAAGWPCQGNSVAGRRGGMGDPRSGLWRHVVRLLAETRPRWFLGENVPGLLSVSGGADIAVVRGDLAQLGYWWAERILDAQHFGVPQRRNRVFFVGHSGDRAAPVSVLLEPEGGAGNPAPGGKARPGTSRAPAGSAGGPGTVGTIGTTGPGGGWRVGADEAAAGQLVTAPLTTRPYADQAASEGSLVAATLQGGGRRGHRIDAEGAAGGHLIPLQASNWGGNGSGIGEDGGPSFTLDGDGSPKAIGVIPFDTAQITSGENRSNPQAGDPAPTMNGNGQVHVAATLRSHPHPHPPMSGAGAVVAHAITRREGKGADSDATSGLIVAAAQSATGTVTHALTAEGADASEDGTEQSDSARYRQCGNAVAVPVAEWIGRRLVAADAALARPEAGAA